MFDDVITFLFSTERGRQVGLGLAGLFGVAAVFTFGNMFLNWRSDYVLSHQPVILKRTSSVFDENALLIAQIPEQHIFGLQAGDDAFLPISSLQLRLTGIIKVKDDSKSKIIVSEAGKPGKIFGIGDELASGIKINTINDDGVILENGGKLEKLPLVRSSLIFHEKPKPLLPKDNQSESEGDE